MDFNQQTAPHATYDSNNRHNRKKGEKHLMCRPRLEHVEQRERGKKGPDVKRGNDPAEMDRLLGPFSIPPGPDATRSDGRRFRDSATVRGFVRRQWMPLGITALRSSLAYC
jgi:hypothetical protein